MSDQAQRIAIVGMAGRFPGADSADAFWDNLLAGRDSITRFTADQLRATEPDLDALLERPNFVAARGVVDGIEQFDAEVFGYSPRDAALIDPQQRLFLESAWDALEQAGIDPERSEAPIGVFAGGGYMAQYLLNNLVRDRAYAEDLVKLRAVDALSTYFANDKDYLATRVAYKLNLRGPALNVQTACSTGLVAVHMGVQSLLAFECDVALAGAVSIALPQERGYLAQEGGMLSDDGVLRAFDADANGTVFSSGLAVFVLKRLEDAEADGDAILAVVRGTAINNDGSDKASFGAPSAEGQADVIAMAQAVADVHPDDIQYIEAHGTGTPLGDPIEVDGLTRAFRRKTDRTGGCLLGSVKPNIGHLDAAAGAAGLVKVVKALQAGTIPRTLHYNAPNPRIDFASTPFRVVGEDMPWPPVDGPRLAGLSSFGVGGTNAHAVIEQAPEAAASAPPARDIQLLMLSAHAPQALAQRCRDLADWLESRPDADLADVAWTLAVGRRQMRLRTSVVARTHAEAITALRQASDRAGAEAMERPDCVFMFSGQGAQHPGMGRALYHGEPVFRETADRLCGWLREPLGLDLAGLLFGDDATAGDRLTQTALAQPALFVLQMATARLWQHWGVQAQAMVGHSLGEVVAACLAGVMGEQDSCRVLADRARLMGDQPGGSMLAVRQARERIEGRLPSDVAVAAVNAPNLCILSGPTEAIDQLAQTLDAAGEETIRLHTSHAFHSPMMDAVVAPFADAMRDVVFKPPTIPIISTVTGQPASAEQLGDPQYWANQIRQPVLFSPALGQLLDGAERVFLECGPSQNLTASARQHRIDGRPPRCVPSLPHASSDEAADAGMIAAVGKLWEAGVHPDWPAFFGSGRRKLALPTYPYQRSRHWIEPPVRGAAVAAVAATPMPSEPPRSMPTMQDAPMPVDNRITRITDALHGHFLELSGIDIEDPSTSFLELGMDSLLLTQAAAAISEDFGVNLRFRQLLEEIDSIDKLAAHLDGLLPADALPAPAAPTTVAPTPAPTAGGTAAVASGSPLEAVIRGQLELMREQLALVTGQGGSGPMPGASARPAASGGPVVHAQLDDGAQGKNLGAGSAGRFGPYRTVERTRDGGLTPKQETFLADLTARFNARTAKSKQMAQASRAHLADPRAVAGFRLSWKEMVYQIVCERSDGSKFIDVDGNEYIDCTLGFGVGFMGHSHPAVKPALARQLDAGWEVGPQTPLSAQVAEKLCKTVGHERATFCNTGSEAVMAALRCARTATNRSKVVYFSGDYHGTFDEVLGRANIVKGALSSRPAAPGIAQDAVDNAMILDYGTQASLDIIREHAHELAAVLVEPVQSRYPSLQPTEFVRELREITRASGTALILDEVITGFRVALGGISECWGIQPDMSTYGKILGGGMPIGALAGDARYLDCIDGGGWQFGDDSLPESPVTFFAGTFVRHPFAMAAADAVLDYLIDDDGALQRDLNARTEAFALAMNAYWEDRDVPLRIRHCSSWFRFDFPQDQPFINLLFYWMLCNGVYIREQAQNCFFSIRHSNDDIARVQAVLREGTEALIDAGFLVPGGASSPGSVEAPASSAGEVVDALAVGESIELTEAQREVWVGQAMDADSGAAFNQAFYLNLEGALDLDALQAGFDHVYARHEALHLRTDARGERQQRVAVEPLRLAVQDVADEATAIAQAQRAAARQMDPETGPLMDVQVLRFAPRHHWLVFVVHHIACDGWSAVNFLEELGQAYSALHRGQTPDLEPAVPFSRYARRIAGRQIESAQARAYWHGVLSPPPAVLTLPTDRPRPAERRFDGATVTVQFGQELVKRVRRLAADHKTTAYTVYLAGFHALLARLSGSDDIVVGIPVAAQALEGENALFGHCVQMLPIRTQMAGSTPFSGLIQSVGERVRGAYAHADCTFGKIIQGLPLHRESGRVPLIEVLFNVDPAGSGVQFDGLESTLHEAPKAFVNFDLFFNFTQSGDGLTLDCDFNTSLFDAGTIRSWARAFEALISHAVESPDDPVSRYALTAQRSGAASEQPQPANAAPLVLDRIQAQVATTPNATAVAHGDGLTTYDELWALSGRVAAGLQAQNVVPGDRVGVCLPRSANLVAVLLGIWRAGAAYVPLDPNYPSERLEYIWRDSDARRVIAADADGFGDRGVALAELLNAEHALAEVPSSPERISHVIYTSGSTGAPKGVMVTQANTAALIQWASDSFSADDCVGVLASTSVCFDLSVFELFLPLVVGGTSVLVDNLLALREPTPAPVSLINSVPSVVSEFLRHARLPDTARTLCLAGEPLSNALVARALDQSQLRRVLDLYGPSECTTYSTMAERHPDRPATIGRAIRGWEVYILDKAGQPVPPGVQGEIVIGGAGVAAGYLGREELTAERFVPNPFTGQGRIYYTGDLGRWTEAGDIVFDGRVDNQIKLRGFRIELGEIESRLGEHPGVLQCVVDVREAAPEDQRLCAWWIAQPGVSTTAAELRKFVAHALPVHMVPQQFVLLDKLPQTPSGKTDRGGLPSPFEAPPAAAIASDTADHDDAMSLVLAVWRQELDEMIDVDANDSFLDVGGHSLLALRAVAAIQEQTGVDIPIRSMMVEPLGAIATRIAVGSGEVETPPDDAGPESRSWLSRFRSKR